MLESIAIAALLGRCYYWYEHRKAAPALPPPTPPTPSSLGFAQGPSPTKSPLGIVPGLSIPVAPLPNPNASPASLATDASLDANMPAAMRAKVLSSLRTEKNLTIITAFANAMIHSPPPGPFPKGAALAIKQAQWLKAQAILHPAVHSALGLDALRAYAKL